jgi:hypothetical protein
MSWIVTAGDASTAAVPIVFRSTTFARGLLGHDAEENLITVGADCTVTSTETAIASQFRMGTARMFRQNSWNSVSRSESGNFLCVTTVAAPGKYRGGLGHIRDFHILTDTVKLLTSVERHGYKPLGIAAGLEGLSNNAVLNPGTTRQQEVRKVTSFALKSGDILSMRSGGGGGYGSPRCRPPH